VTFLLLGFSSPSPPSVHSMSQESLRSMDSEEELLDWIEYGAQNDEELRQVLKYLVLLDASAVEKAIRYVQRGAQHKNKQQGNQQQQSSTIASERQTPFVPLQEQRQPPQERLTVNSKSPSWHQEGLVPTFENTMTPQNPYSQIHSQTQSNTPLQWKPTEPVSTPSPNNNATTSLSSSSTHRQPPRQLLVLCTSKPSSRKEGDDQDNAMKICREASVFPYIILKESKPVLAEALLRISNINHYPQFFWQSRLDVSHDQQDHHGGDNASRSTAFLGDFDLIHQLFLQGQFHPSPIQPKRPSASPVVSQKFGFVESPTIIHQGIRQSDPPHHPSTLRQEYTSDFSSLSTGSPAVDHSTKFNQPLETTAKPPSHLDGPQLSVPNQPSTTVDPRRVSSEAQQYPRPGPIEESDFSMPLPSAAESSTAFASQPVSLPMRQSPFKIPVPQTPAPAPTPKQQPMEVRSSTEPTQSQPQDSVQTNVSRTVGWNKQRPSGHIEEPDDTTISSSTQRPSSSPGTLSRATLSLQSLPPAKPSTPDILSPMDHHAFSSPKRGPIDHNSSIEERENTSLPAPPQSIADKVSIGRDHMDAQRSTVTSHDTEPQKVPNLGPPSARNLEPGTDSTSSHSNDSSAATQTWTNKTTVPPSTGTSAIDGRSNPSPIVERQKYTSGSPGPKNTNTAPTKLSTKQTPSYPLSSDATESPLIKAKNVTSSQLTNTYPQLPLPNQQGTATPTSARSLIKPQQTTFSEAQVPFYPKLPVPDQPLHDTNSNPKAITNRKWGNASRTAPSESTSNYDTEEASMDTVPRNGIGNSLIQTTSPTLPINNSKITPAANKGPSLPVSPARSSNRLNLQHYPKGGACYLVYDSSRAELNIHYSEFPIEGSVGVWTTPHIKAFKEAQGLGRSEMIGNCARGTNDPQQYCNGWCQFITAARSMEATVTILGEEVVRGSVLVDFYLYKDGTTNLVQYGTFETETVDAVACLPRNAEFATNLQGKKWVKAAKKRGGVAVFQALSGGPSTSRNGDQYFPDTPSSMESAATPQTGSTQGDRSSLDHQYVSTSSPMLPSPSLNPISPPRQELAAPAPPDPVPVTSNSHGGYASALHAPHPPNGACYLVYEPDSSGRLVEHCSKTPVPDAIGRWVPSGSKKMPGFKFTQNLGRNVLIGNCSAGVQGRKNYSSGWCQFVRSARVMEAEVMLWDPVTKGLMVDVYLYQDDLRPTHQTVKLVPGIAQGVEKTLAVACIPRNTPFYEGMCVDILKWLGDGSNYGASSRF